MEEMGKELRSNGLKTIGGTNERGVFEPFVYEELKDYPFDDEVGAVVCGIDF